jgi:hypothetical protein
LASVFEATFLFVSSTYPGKEWLLLQITEKVGDKVGDEETKGGSKKLEGG